MVEKYLKNRHKNSIFWKPGDKIICIENAGKSELTIGKEYTIIKITVDHGADEVQIRSDIGISSAFCSRFTTIKDERKNKLQKIKNSI